MFFETADVAGLRLFYREAGDPSHPNIVLLQGFPSSSYQFHDLIPHVLAWPGTVEFAASTIFRPTGGASAVT